MTTTEIEAGAENLHGGERLSINFDQYKALLGRYKDVERVQDSSNRKDGEALAFDIEAHITDTDAGIIDYEWINDRFAKYTSKLSDFSTEEGNQFLDALHTSFNQLDAETKIIAEGILSDIRSGKLFVEEGKSFVDYLNERKAAQSNSYSESLHRAFGISVALIEEYLKLEVDQLNTARNTRITEEIDTDCAIEYFKFKNKDDKPLPPFIAKLKAKDIIEEFFSCGGYDLYEDEE